METRPRCRQQCQPAGTPAWAPCPFPECLGPRPGAPTLGSFCAEGRARGLCPAAFPGARPPQGCSSTRGAFLEQSLMGEPGVREHVLDWRRPSRLCASTLAGRTSCGEAGRSRGSSPSLAFLWGNPVPHFSCLSPATLLARLESCPTHAHCPASLGEGGCEQERAAGGPGPPVTYTGYPQAFIWTCWLVGRDRLVLGLQSGHWLLWTGILYLPATGRSLPALPSCAQSGWPPTVTGLFSAGRY